MKFDFPMKTNFTYKKLSLTPVRFIFSGTFMKAAISFCLLTVVYNELPLKMNIDIMSEDDKPPIVLLMPERIIYNVCLF